MRPVFGVPFLAAVTLLTAGTGCRNAPGQGGVVWPTQPIAAALETGGMSMGPQLTSSARGTILSWLDIQDTTAVLRYSERGSAGTWSAPRTVTQGTDWFVSEVDMPAAPVRRTPFTVGDAGVAVAPATGLLALDPVLVTGSEEGRLRLGLSRPVAGAPVFDAEGNLAAIAGTEGDGWAVDAALARLDALAPAIPVLVGIVLQTPGDDPAPGAGGARIAEVPGSGGAPASEARER